MDSGEGAAFTVKLLRQVWCWPNRHMSDDDQTAQEEAGHCSYEGAKKMCPLGTFWPREVPHQRGGSKCRKLEFCLRWNEPQEEDVYLSSVYLLSIHLSSIIYLSIIYLPIIYPSIYILSISQHISLSVSINLSIGLSIYIYF